MLALYPAEAHYLPDFTTPPPEGPYPVFEEELERIRTTPHDEVAKEVRRVYEGREMPPGAARFLERPDDALEELVGSMRRYWETAIEPHWPRMRALLEGDVLYRARTLALEGPQALFANLHPEVSWKDGVLSLDKHTWDEDVKPVGRGIVLIPLVFGCPKLVAMWDEPWQPTLAYPPRGLATLWEADAPRPATALLELVGESKAAILHALEIPMTTSEVAARLGVTPGSGLPAARAAPAGRDRRRQPERTRRLQQPHPARDPAPGAAQRLRLVRPGDFGILPALGVVRVTVPSSSGLGHHPLKVETRVRTPLGLLL